MVGLRRGDGERERPGYCLPGELMLPTKDEDRSLAFTELGECDTDLLNPLVGVNSLLGGHSLMRDCVVLGGLNQLVLRGTAPVIAHRVERTVAHRRPAAHEERPASPQHDGSPEGKLNPDRDLWRDVMAQVEAREMPTHLQDHGRYCQRRADPEASRHVDEFGTGA